MYRLVVCGVDGHEVDEVEPSHDACGAADRADEWSRLAMPVDAGTRARGQLTMDGESRSFDTGFVDELLRCRHGARPGLLLIRKLDGPGRAA